MQARRKGEMVVKIQTSLLAAALFLSATLPAFAQQGSANPGLPNDGPQTLPSPAPTPGGPGLIFTPEPAAATAPSASLKHDMPAAQATPGTLPSPAVTSDGQTASSVTPPEVTPLQPLSPITAPQSSVNDENGDAGKLAQASTSSSNRSPLDPAFRKLPTTSGQIKLRKPFVLVASQTLIHNLSFRDTPVKEVIAELARRGNLNVIIDKSIMGKITGDLHDVTLNEAIDTVLVASGIQYRALDNSTIIFGSPGAMFQLGLNRPVCKIFKLSYANAFEISSILFTTVFNKGYIPDFSLSGRNRFSTSGNETGNIKSVHIESTSMSAPGAGGGQQTTSTNTQSTNGQDNTESNEQGNEYTETVKPEGSRAVRGSSRVQFTEGTGFNASSTDPGSQSIRAYQAVVTDFPVEQNGGGAIVIPDMRNNQIIVCGTQDDVTIAEECVHLIDRRPKMVHVQSSLIELSSGGVRQLGAAFNLQGEGASGSVLGGSGAPLVNFLPGLGGNTGNLTLTRTITNAAGVLSTQLADLQSGIPPVPIIFNELNPVSGVRFQQNLTGTVSPVQGPPGNGFGGFLGTALPSALPQVTGIQASPQSQTGFNFLALGKRAGGRTNIATLPTGLNITLNMVLQSQKAKVLANPSILVNDNCEGLIVLANEVVHKVTTTVSLGVVSTNVELVKAGIFLNVLPRVTEDGFIVMRLRPQVSSPLGGPQIFGGGSVIVTLLNVRDILEQEVRVKDGQTLVIGGLFTEQEASNLAKVPYLAEAPILGAIFRNTIKGRNRTELMLLITPKVVEDQPNSPIGEAPAPVM